MRPRWGSLKSSSARAGRSGSSAPRGAPRWAATTPTTSRDGCWPRGVNLDVIAVAGRNDDNVIRIQSAGFPMDTIDLSDVSVRECEKNTAASLIRGVAAKFVALGYRIGGFDAYTTSSVLKGSGLSSSAAFETIVGTMLNCLYAGGAATPVQIAQIGQYAENAYFGKPSGLMDQMGCSVGGFITIDFQNPEKPVVEKVDFDFAHSGYKLCVVDTGGNHADLTGDYAAAPVEMRAVAEALGGKVLRDVAPETFYAALPALARQVHRPRPAARLPLLRGQRPGARQGAPRSGGRL